MGWLDKPLDAVIIRSVAMIVRRYIDLHGIQRPAAGQAAIQ